jgi:group I intron endonuclease
MLVYKITNIINNKIYVGQTTIDLQKRWKQHFYKRKNGTKIANAINKYGRENFKIEIIETCKSLQELNKQEEYWIHKLRAAETGYNILKGGLNRKQPDYVKEKLSKIFLGKKLKKEHREKLSKINKERILAKGVHQNSLKALNKNYKKWEKPVICLENKKIYKSVSEAARDINSSSSNVSKQIKGKFSHVKSYTFEYLEKN